LREQCQLWVVGREDETEADPMAHLFTKHYVEGGLETLLAHIAELQKLRDACGGLGIDITDAQFARVIILSMPTPSWDPVVGALAGVLDPKIVISQLNTKWSRRQGLTSTGKDSNMVFQTGTQPKCENCNKLGHVKAKCWARGGGQEGQYLRRYNSQTSNTSTPSWTLR